MMEIILKFGTNTENGLVSLIWMVLKIIKKLMPRKIHKKEISDEFE